MQKFLIAGLVLNVQKVRKSVLAEDKLHDIGARMETNPRKPLCELAVYSAVTLLSSQATKLLKLHPHQIEQHKNCCLSSR